MRKTKRVQFMCEPIDDTQPKIKSAYRAQKVFYNNWEKSDLAYRERMYAIFLNTENRLITCELISIGGMTGTYCDKRIIFKMALDCGATAFILAHNHPSGAMRTSKPDKQLTDDILKASKIMEISLLDHLIISPNGEYFSMAENGEL